VNIEILSFLDSPFTWNSTVWLNKYMSRSATASVQQGTTGQDTLRWR